MGLAELTIGVRRRGPAKIREIPPEKKTNTRKPAETRESSCLLSVATKACRRHANVVHLDSSVLTPPRLPESPLAA